MILLRLLLLVLIDYFLMMKSFVGLKKRTLYYENIGVPNLMVESDDPEIINMLFIALSPDIIIRQSPWDHDIPEVFSAKNLCFTKLCYLPYYATNVVKQFIPDNQFDFQSNQDLHNLCWRIYTDSLLSMHDAKLRSLIGGLNVRYFGNSKLQHILNKAQLFESRTLSTSLNILWAPHHSIDDKWLGFGTFHKNYNDFLEFAKKNQQHHFVLRPYPALFTVMKSRFSDGMSNFIMEWPSPPNTEIDNNFDYLKTFEKSDIMITDGISFLVEYPLVNKTIIFMNSGNHAELNDVGSAAVNCAYQTDSFLEIESCISKIQSGELKPLLTEVGILKNILLIDKDNNVANKIVTDLLESL